MTVFKWHWRHRGADYETRVAEVEDLRRERVEDHEKAIQSFAATMERWDRTPQERQIRAWNEYQLKGKLDRIRRGTEKV